MAVLSEQSYSDFRKGQTEQYRPKINEMYEVLDIHVDAVLKDQLAEITVTQTIQNPGNRSLEVQILFPLPNDGVVQSFMMMVDGQEVPGQLMPKDEARRIYEEIVNSRKDPALMEYVGYGLFKTSVFPIPVGAQRKLTIRYSQLCSKQSDLISFAYPFGTQRFSAKPLRTMSLNLRIIAGSDIKNIYSPTDDVSVKRDGNRNASVTMQQTNVLPDHDFKLMYSQANGDVGVSLLTYKPTIEDNGYFMLMASPSFSEPNAKPLPKNVVFVIDRSGSMSGKKIEQSRNALEFVLKNLREEDRFNIVIYDDRIESFSNEMLPCNKKNLDEAIKYVRMISAAGGTNIHDALSKGLSYFTHNETPNYLIFLTDGVPTSGTTNEQSIITNTEKVNTQKARLFCFGVGNDVNARLLDRLSQENGGRVEYVTPNQDVEAAVASLFNAISEPVLTDIEVAFNGIPVTQTYPTRLPDMFRGGQLVLTGQYRSSGKTTVTITGKVNGKARRFDFPVEFNSNKAPNTHQYVEKIWASKRVAHLITEIDKNGKNKELIDELVALSKQYGILTPYTSFLAREDVNFADASGMQKRASQNLDQLNDVSGESANTQRAQKNSMAESARSNAPAGAFASNADKESVNRNVLNVGQKTFFLKDNKWVDGTINDTDIKTAVKINRFSSEYFNLAKGETAEFNRYLTVEGNVLVKHNGKVYNIVP